jgi:hypothetical protein
MSQLSTTESRFTGLTNLLREKYLTDVMDTVHEHGTDTMRRLKPSQSRTNVRDNYIQFITAHADNARASNDLLADYRKPNKHKAAKINYRYDPDNPSSNDFRGIDGVARLSLAEVHSLGGSTEGQVKLAEMVTRQVFHGIDATGTFFMHSDSTAAKGNVNGTKVNVTTDFANGATYTAGSTACTFAVDNVSIGNFREGDMIDVYNSNTLIANDLMVRHVDYDQNAITVQKTADTTASNLDSIADNYTLYRSGEKGMGFLTSFGEFFKETVSSGDSWVGGVDRSTIDNLYLQPMKLRRGQSVELPDEEHLNQLGKAMGYAQPGTDSMPLTLFAGDSLIRAFRNIIGDSVFVHSPSSGGNDKHQIGNTSLRYVDPKLGVIELVGDNNARNDRMYLVNTADWEILRGGIQDLEIPTAGGAYGYFERMEGTNSHRGGSKIFRMECSTWWTPIVKRMDRCAAIFNLSDNY